MKNRVYTMSSPSDVSLEHVSNDLAGYLTRRPKEASKYVTQTSTSLNDLVSSQIRYG